MQFLVYLSLVLSFSLAAIANPVWGDNLLEKRRAQSCTSYSSANRAISECNTASAFCSSYIKRGPSTSTVYTTTSTQTSTPPTVTLKKTYTAKTITQTSYTSTVTITASPVYTTRVVSVTSSATESDTLTISTTQTVTFTSSVTATNTQSQLLTTTVPNRSCTTGPLKRSIQQRAPAVNPSCNVGGMPPAQITGACQCFLDRTTSAAATATITLQRSVTTQSFPTTGTIIVKRVSNSTTTPTSTVYVTSTVLTKTIATVTSNTVTTTQSTLTAAIITSTVGTTTTTVTSTITSTTPVATCDPNNSTVTYNGQDYETSCGVQFSGYDLYVTDSTDIYDCTNQCQTLNDRNISASYPTFCLAVAFDNNQCNNNCHLMAGVNSNSTNNTAAGWDSARMVSPAIGEYGDYCLDGTTKFGDLYQTPNGTIFQILCGVEYPGDDIYCAPLNPNHNCYDTCGRTEGCLSASYFYNGSPGNSCCLKYSHPASAYKVRSDQQVDGSVLVHGANAQEYDSYSNYGPYDPNFGGDGSSSSGECGGDFYLQAQSSSSVNGEYAYINEGSGHVHWGPFSEAFLFSTSPTGIWEQRNSTDIAFLSLADQPGLIQFALPGTYSNSAQLQCQLNPSSGQFTCTNQFSGDNTFGVFCYGDSDDHMYFATPNNATNYNCDVVTIFQKCP